MAGWVINELPRWIIFGAWLLINIALFIFQFHTFQATDRFYYMRIRTRCPPRTVKRLLDKNLTFHKAIAWMLVVSSAIHVIAHWYNYERLVGLADINALRDKWPWERRFVPQDAQPGLPPVSTDPITICFVTAAGVTGHVITVALFLMVTSSLEFIRRSYFEVFWYTHHLFIIFLLGLAAHQAQMLLPVQTNSPDRTDNNMTHNPELCSEINRTFEDVNVIQDLPNNGLLNVTFNNGTNTLFCPAATFNPAPPCSWKYMLGGLIIYAIERVVRFIRGFRSVVIIKVVEHPSKTIEIQMRQKGFFAEAGQYVFINVPSVAFFEWHPFTLTSAPEEDYFSVHIRIVGDWTEEVARQMGVGRDEFTQSWQLPKIAIDGPFGTASEDVFFHNVGLLVGAGIGVTPFASILKSIFYKVTNEDAGLKLKKVYFYWICPTMQSFEWFRDLLASLEEQMISKGISEFLDTHIYLTRGWKDTQAYAIQLREGDEVDAITKLQAKTNFGRPDWPKIFDSISHAHPDTSVGVFFCGPPGLSHQLHSYANEYSKKGSDVSRARFYYNKENF